MTLEEIARTLVANCREGREHEGLSELYDPSCESVEAADPPGGSRISKGVEAIRGKHEWWAEAFEMHGGEVDGPYLHGPDRFAVIFEMDVTEKSSGQRWKGREVALYTVQEGRIVKEEFFQAPM
jgi:ketosteroid isomerase-like protein